MNEIKRSDSRLLEHYIKHLEAAGLKPTNQTFSLSSSSRAVGDDVKHLPVMQQGGLNLRLSQIPLTDSAGPQAPQALQAVQPAFDQAPDQKETLRHQLDVLVQHLDEVALTADDASWEEMVNYVTEIRERIRNLDNPEQMQTVEALTERMKVLTAHRLASKSKKFVRIAEVEETKTDDKSSCQNVDDKSPTGKCGGKDNVVLIGGVPYCEECRDQWNSRT